MKYLLIVFVLISTAVWAQNQPLVNVATGQTVSIRDYKGAKAVVVIFTSNVCAYDGYYTDRLKSLFSAYSGSVQFLLVNSNQEAEESEEKMKAKHSSWGIDVPYLSDKDQTWMTALGARKSPEVFVLDKDLKTIYSGAIDDNPQLANGVKDYYLKRVLDGQTVAGTRAVGCSIRLK